MTPLEVLVAARDRLQQLRDERGYVAEGEWLIESVDSCTCAGVDQFEHPAHERGCGTVPVTNDAYFLTLHRTVDAQIAILDAAIEQVPVLEGHGIDLAHGLGSGLVLARAVLGDTEEVDRG